MRVYVGRVRELAERFPLGASIALVELERYDNSALLARLSENEPVTWFAEQGVWLVTSKALVEEVHRSPDRFSVEVPINPQRVVMGDMMLVVDGTNTGVTERRFRARSSSAPYALGSPT